MHQPVLLKEMLQYLKPRAGESYLDLTAGYGGHASAVIGHTGAPSRAVLVDRDAEAIGFLKEQFRNQGVQIIHQDFLSASRALEADGHKFKLILADLGTSSPHFENADRGFSIRHPGPLDMRMDRRQALTAEEIVNTFSEAELARIFNDYGEEPKAREIARLIVRHRPFKTTDQLAELAAKSARWRMANRPRIHPATRVFQALRIAVNHELNQLEKALPIWLDLLLPGGRLVVISFHSLEDRLVKEFFNENSINNYSGQLEILTAKPIMAARNETVYNPRARSAKLRAAAKIKTKKKG